MSIYLFSNLTILILFALMGYCMLVIRNLQGMEYNKDMGSKSKKSSKVAIITEEHLIELESTLKAHSAGMEVMSRDITFAVNDLSYKIHKLAAQAGFKWDEDKQEWVLESGIVTS